MKGGGEGRGEAVKINFGKVSKRNITNVRDRLSALRSGGAFHSSEGSAAQADGKWSKDAGEVPGSRTQCRGGERGLGMGACLP